MISSKKSSGIGVLTGADRDVWADARQHLVEELGNGEALGKIDSALYAISLDDDHWHHQVCTCNVHESDYVGKYFFQSLWSVFQNFLEYFRLSPGIS